MVHPRCIGYFLLSFSFFPAVGSTQTSNPTAEPSADIISLDVVVTSKSGSPVSGLHEQDFSILGNKVPVALNSFQALGGNQPPVEVVLVVDAVNTGFSNVAFERSEIDKLLRANGGHLAYPTTIAVLTDAGLQRAASTSKNRSALHPL